MLFSFSAFRAFHSVALLIETVTNTLVFS